MSFEINYSNLVLSEQRKNIILYQNVDKNRYEICIENNFNYNYKTLTNYQYKKKQIVIYHLYDEEECEIYNSFINNDIYVRRNYDIYDESDESNENDLDDQNYELPEENDFLPENNEFKHKIIKLCDCKFDEMWAYCYKHCRCGLEGKWRFCYIHKIYNHLK